MWRLDRDAPSCSTPPRESPKYLNNGVDGIFFDEADPLLTERNFPYYQRLAARVGDEGKTVILNAGVSRCGEAIMRVTDTLMVEHAWRDLTASCPWTRHYGRDGFIGVSSTESDMGYTVDEQRAIQDTHEAWQSGNGWHTSTSRYVELPDWFSAYVQNVKGGSWPAAALSFDRQCRRNAVREM